MKFKIIILLFLVISCRREKEELLEKHIGLYHFSYAVPNDYSVLMASELENQYAMKIVNNTKIESYIDGKIYETYFVDSYSKTANVYQYKLKGRKLNNSENILLLIEENGKFTIKNIPLKNKDNVYYK